ncbi:hypothetical protein [Maricaulis sp.]|uniref:TolB family protein n=1 Tax=unclassified Maricaulis TaxID=2632371 RepID=UPI001B05A5AB|nr:hypothetical protein [Maricaulis sp.]MBO6798459.1 PD40 domain-containing protein [Maricaulis sp.]
MRVSIIAALVTAAVSGAASAQGAHPQVSPDGERVAYFSFDMSARSASIHVYSFASGETETLDTGTLWSVNPTWHPSENRIAFGGAVGGMSDAWNVYEMNLDTGEVTQLTDTAQREAHTHYSPDGTRLAFVRMGPTADVFILDLASREVTAVTSTEGREFHVKWADNDTLVYDLSEGERSWIVAHDIGGAIHRIEGAVEDGRVGLPAVQQGTGALAFAIRGPAGSELVVLRGDARTVAYAAETRWNVGGSYWRPGREEIVFTIASEDRVSRLMVVNPETGEARPLIAED